MMQGMRRVLAGGLDTHLRTNPLLSDMFSVRISARGGDGARMSTAEKVRQRHRCCCCYFVTLIPLCPLHSAR